MRTIIGKELRSSVTNWLIWTLAVGGLGLACILLYASMGDSVQEIADTMAAMGAFSDAFGMNTLSIATLSGYFATEVGTVHGLGGGMFAASAAITILSKEENNHSAEFLMTLPVSRRKVVTAKAIAVTVELIMFTLCCALMYIVGFMILDQDIPMKEFIIFMGMQLLMNVEIAGTCLLISGACSDNRLGLGMGIALMLYLYDLMARVIPSLKDSAIITPYSYANASEIFAGQKMPSSAIILGVIIIILCISGTYACYCNRDLKA